MLRITIPATVSEDFDDETNEFLYTIVSEEQTLELEHSLVSLKKWESKWHKPFLTKAQMTREEALDYIRCMALDENVDPEIFSRLTDDNIDKITEYINAPMTATTFSEDKSARRNREVVTAELIYYWMISANIPFECQHWHLNELITLIRVCSVKNSPPKKMSKKDVASQYAALNAARRKQLNSRG